MKVIIVDDNDNPIGLAERDKWEDNAIHRVSAIWLTNSKGEVFIAQRALSKRHAPGQWGPAASGTVEEGETYETNAMKEIEEEIGISITQEQLKLGPKVLMNTPGDRRFVQWYVVTADVPRENFKLQEEEVADAKWIGVKELEQRMTERPDEFTKSLSPETLSKLLGKA
jgi:isopentenyldiphosphate isomerase